MLLSANSANTNTTMTLATDPDKKLDQWVETEIRFAIETRRDAEEKQEPEQLDLGEYREWD